MPYLSKEQLEKLPTKRLLAYKKKHFPSNNPLFHEDWVHNCNCPECLSLKRHLKEYTATYTVLKELLSKRPHVAKRQI